MCKSGGWLLDWSGDETPDSDHSKQQDELQELLRHQSSKTTEIYYDKLYATKANFRLFVLDLLSIILG